MQRCSRRFVRTLACLGGGLLWACTNLELPPSAPIESAEAPKASAESGPAPTAALPEETTQTEIVGRTYVFSRFDYAPQEIVLDSNTVRFLAREYDFVYCRAENS